MITFRDSFSQMSVAQTIRQKQNQYVAKQLESWLASNAFPSNCLTPETDRDSLPLDKWQFETDLAPESSYLLKVELFVCKNDISKETGIAREIGFVWYHCHCDRYGAPQHDWQVGGRFVTNGILFNHGSESEPSWSVHT